MNLKHKSFPVAGLKVLSEDEGIVEAFTSVFNNVDHAKERVLHGAFTKSLQKKLPKVVWGHDWLVPVGKVIDAEEISAGDPRLPDEIKSLGGLYTKQQYNLDTQRGREAFSDIKFGAVDEWSFGYLVKGDSYDKETKVRDLLELEVYEVSPVLVGCNPATVTVGAKGTDFKAQYLGDYIESSMTMAALSRLQDALFYNVVWETLYDENTPMPERLERLQAAFGEFRDIVLRTIEAIMGKVDAEEAVEAGKSIRALWRDPATVTDLNTFSLAEKTLPDHSETTLAVVREYATRITGLKALRVKEGRTLSDANRQRLQQHIDALEGVCGDMKALLEEATPMAAQDDILKALARFEEERFALTQRAIYV